RRAAAMPAPTSARLLTKNRRDLLYAACRSSAADVPVPSVVAEAIVPTPPFAVLKTGDSTRPAAGAYNRPLPSSSFPEVPMPFLFKEEPASYSYDDFARDGSATWTGVKNPVAQKPLASVKKGDLVFYYHTG